ncbi:hypothetical protein [Sphingomonas turrisvirgatae]|uniref:Uncharacterized protein n=1 Tax=Sphingomonas turrisvirgatae TaxID=1888892 RepID=A0A1E3M118_9SPHN|nr:hypothetical protein [Sphingomonas turrisvirgatae]ODP39663.1 hypothetical protein BFL28_08485 [Sphingomonas turrisvirgatae]
MLTLLLAMSAAVETPRIVTLPKRARPAATASVRKRAPVRQARKAPARTAKLCVTGSCTPAAASPYRLTDTSEARFNGKLDIVGKQTKMACGVQGAPVCPARGAQLTSVPID